ncbi:MAG: WD40 repeat domain-containing protein, partial [Acidobacteriaceae bacterium]
MKNKRLWIFTGVFALIIAGLLLLNFRLALSSTQVNKLVSSTSMGDNVPMPLQRKDTISVAVLGEGSLANAVKSSLKDKMDRAGIGLTELVEERVPVYQNPVLVVRVGKPGSFWTPLFATSQFSVHAGYASNGDSTFFEAVENTHTTIGKPDVVNMYAEYDIVDRSFGVLSRPGYHQYLADYVTEEIVTVLKDMYNPNPAPIPTVVAVTPDQSGAAAESNGCIPAMTPAAFFHGGEKLLGFHETQIQIYDLKSHHIEVQFEVPARVVKATVSPDGQTIAAGLENYSILLVRTSDQQVLQTLTKQRGNISGLAFYPTGDYLLSASEDTWVRTWSLDGQEVDAFQPSGADDFPSDVMGIGISPDWTSLATIPVDGLMNLWSLPEHQLLS